jgi:hypothetical protein
MKINMVRCLKDKAPAGSYLIRASVLDRLIDNKMYYKFIELGNLEKEKESINREEEEKRKLEEEEEESRKKLMEHSSANEFTHTVSDHDHAQNIDQN